MNPIDLVIGMTLGNLSGIVIGIILASVFGFTWSKAMGILAKKVPSISAEVRQIEADVAGLAHQHPATATTQAPGAPAGTAGNH